MCRAALLSQFASGGMWCYPGAALARGGGVPQPSVPTASTARCCQGCSSALTAVLSCSSVFPQRRGGLGRSLGFSVLMGFRQCSGKRGHLGVAHRGLESLPGCVGAEEGGATLAPHRVPTWALSCRAGDPHALFSVPQTSLA